MFSNQKRNKSKTHFQENNVVEFSFEFNMRHSKYFESNTVSSDQLFGW